MKFWNTFFSLTQKFYSMLFTKKGMLTISGYIFFGLLVAIAFTSAFYEHIPCNGFITVLKILFALYFFLFLLLLPFVEKHIQNGLKVINSKSYMLFLFYGAVIIFGYFHISKMIFNFSFLNFLFPKYIFEFIFICYAILSILWFAYHNQNNHNNKELKRLSQKWTVLATLAQLGISRFSDTGVFCLSILLVSYVYIQYLLEYDSELKGTDKKGD